MGEAYGRVKTSDEKLIHEKLVTKRIILKYKFLVCIFYVLFFIYAFLASCNSYEHFVILINSTTSLPSVRIYKMIVVFQNFCRHSLT